VPVDWVVQSKHAPLNPHAFFWAPFTHVPAWQQNPPAQLPSLTPPHRAVHAPLTHVGVAFEHALQLSPSAPHTEFSVPGTHTPPEQQPRLHGWFWLQTLVQTFFATSHANSVGHSAEVVQPHTPPMQRRPRLDIRQSEQMPLVPHALFWSPTRQVPPLAFEQQPPLHGLVLLHAVVHLSAIGSQAVLVGQLLELLQPQAPPGRHTAPSLPLLQSTQVVPMPPQEVLPVPGWQVPFTASEQHPNTHFTLALHTLLQIFVCGLQFVLLMGQSEKLLHPH